MENVDSSKVSRAWGIMAILVLMSVLMARHVAALSETPEERQVFEEMMAVEWLTCRFEAIDAGSGEMLERISLDPQTKRSRLITFPREENNQNLRVLKSEIFGGPITLVLNAKKRQVRWLPPPWNSGGEGEFDLPLASVNVQQVDWLNPGAIQITNVFSKKETNSSSVMTIVVFPVRVADAGYAAFATFPFALSLFVVSGQCAEEIADELRSKAEQIRREFESGEGDAVTEE